MPQNATRMAFLETMCLPRGEESLNLRTLDSVYSPVKSGDWVQVIFPKVPTNKSLPQLSKTKVPLVLSFAWGNLIVPIWVESLFSSGK